MSFDNFMNVERNPFLIIMEFKIGIAILQLLEVLRFFVQYLQFWGSFVIQGKFKWPNTILEEYWGPDEVFKSFGLGLCGGMGLDILFFEWA